MEQLAVLIIGVIGNIISVLVFLAPIGTFWRIIKNRSTEEFDSLPYICTLLNAALWTYYGIIRPGEVLVATVNGFGAVVEAIYIVIFLIYAPRKIKVKTAIIAGVVDIVLLLAATLITGLTMQGDLKISVTGFICAGLNILMYGSPLAAMRTVVRTKSVEYMPFFLSFFLFLNGGIWATYAVLVRDLFLGIPNGTGFILGTMQLVLYAIYRNAKPSENHLKNNISNVLEEGWQHEHLLSSPNPNSEE